MSAEKTVLQNVSSKMRLMGWLSIIFGVLAIAMPWVAGQSILMMVGILVMAAGIMRMIWAFQAGSLGKGILVFLIGVLTLLAGVAVIAHPLMSSAVLSIMLAVYFLADGFSELIAAFSVKEGKGWLLFDAVITILLGIMIFTGFPLSGTVAIGVFLGIKLLFVGITMLTIRSAAKNAF
ncbi:MAG: DUF308 domain-containing protein [Xanthomonadales bacterium]|jgi:uncharacterized membrane protein HdeD (DUF308 family)|nr:DUF308 domain-containing protein [Xanthomonadales bacterium]